MSAANSVLAVSAGDPQGIGPEVTSRAVRKFTAARPDARFILIGDRRALEHGFETRLPEWTASTSEAVAIIDVPLAADAGPAPSMAGGAAGLAAFERGIDLVVGGHAAGLVTGPLSKEAVARSRPGFVGHTEWLARRCRRETVMLLAHEGLRVFLVTDHLPLRAVPDAVTAERLRFVITSARSALTRLYGCERPNLAVLGLNPHAGEGGELGREETDIVVPTLRDLGGPAGGVHGPFSADSFFAPGLHQSHDGVVAMYHDQGLIPLKATGFKCAVNITLGLPFPRTSPGHGTAFGLAGQGRADDTSMLEAIAMCDRWVRSDAANSCRDL